MSEVHPMNQSLDAAQMAAQRLVRYRDLIPCKNAFVDTYTPGSDQKENFTIIGPGVSENPDQHVHIPEPHGFNIGGARQPPGCTNSQHSHETEEVFIVHSGRWAFRWGDKCQDGEAILEEGDCISIPTNVFRGFENIGDNTGYLFAVLGGDDPGSVLWAPDVFDKAEDYGLVLLENGNLVDTTKGESVPAGMAPMPRTSEEQVSAARVMSLEEMLACISTSAEQRAGSSSSLSSVAPGVQELPVIGEANSAEGIGAGKLAWPHCFNVRRLEFSARSYLPLHTRDEEEVVYVHRGSLNYLWDGQSLTLGAGDVLTVPIGLAHAFENSTGADTIAFFVRGSRHPAAPSWQEASLKDNHSTQHEVAGDSS
ncbi:MAG: cupin domain-containing protein [Pseudomonadota bacterium]